MAAMPWNGRCARLNEIQLQRTNGTLSTQLLQLREQLRNKESYAARLEILLRQRNERIDQLTAQVDQLKEHSRHTAEEARHMAMFVGMMLDLNDAVAAKQSVAGVIG
jgi:TolA-binding protein